MKVGELWILRHKYFKHITVNARWEQIITGSVYITNNDHIKVGFRYVLESSSDDYVAINGDTGEFYTAKEHYMPRDKFVEKYIKSGIMKREI